MKNRVFEMYENRYDFKNSINRFNWNPGFALL